MTWSQKFCYPLMLCLLVHMGTEASFAESKKNAQTASAAQQREEIQRALPEADAMVAEASAMQRDIDRYDDETRAALREYQGLVFEIDALEKGIAQYEVVVQGQEKELKELTVQKQRTEELKAELFPLMQEQVAALEKFIELDMPFLLEERTARIARLRDSLSRSDLSDAEKYRMIAEAYEIEVEYGRSLEAYRGTLAKDGDQQVSESVDFLRVGRIGLYYRTVDEQRVFAYDRDAAQWVALADEDKSRIAVAFSVARKERLPEYLQLPVSISAEPLEAS